MTRTARTAVLVLAVVVLAWLAMVALGVTSPALTLALPVVAVAVLAIHGATHPQPRRAHRPVQHQRASTVWAVA